MFHEHDLASPELLARLVIAPSSLTRQSEIVFGVSEIDPANPQLALIAEPGAAAFDGFAGETSVVGDRSVLLGPRGARNAAALRRSLPWLRPSTFGLRTSAGLGDRLGIATPGHVRALREVGGTLAPMLAQQSIREMGRTGRNPQQVMDDAMWGAFAEGWQLGFAADADHLKTPEDIDRCVAAGYTFYTFDPSAYVDSAADTTAASELRTQFDALPWEQLGETPAAAVKRYVSAPVECEEYRIAFDETSLMRAAVKYGRAVAHVAALYRHLEQVNAGADWEVEVSVDETETPTTHGEHVYWAMELRRLGIRWVSLAPRFIGRFEKGVDYIGDLDAFTADFAVHAAIARTLGPYKLSLHSGSDKFSIYAIAVEATHGVVHLKTAGTSYLEALRTVGELNPTLLREIYAFSRERYPTDRASYHVSAELGRAPEPESIALERVATLLDQFDAREILHVTFGSVLTARTAEDTSLFYERVMSALRAHPAAYARNLMRHFVHHLQPFAAHNASSEGLTHS